jgi:hypothetical protein
MTRKVMRTMRLDRTSRTLPVAAMAAGTVALLGVLTACGGSSGGPDKLAGAAAPAVSDGTQSSQGAHSSGGGHTSATSPDGGKGGTSGSAGGQALSSSASQRCTTADLRLSVGDGEPGAGQENFPLVLTNTSKRTCTLQGYPGAEFQDVKNDPITSDPTRVTGDRGVITLAPGKSGWAPLSFANPEVSGATSATPARLVVTPPDEKRSLSVSWSAGEVPTAGNSSDLRVGPFQSGTGS